jgi:casein kinase 1
MTLYTPISNRDPEQKIIQIVSILETIHHHLVIHRDIKPQNFMEKNGNVFLIYFGLSSVYVDEEKHHLPNTPSPDCIIGTPNYISINIHNGETPSRRDDLISAGYVYLFLLYGYVPWETNRLSILYNNTANENDLKKQAKLDFHRVEENKEENENRHNIVRYFHYCNQLTYDETPDYYSLTSNLLTGIDTGK